VETVKEKDSERVQELGWKKVGPMMTEESPANGEEMPGGKWGKWGKT